MKKIRFCALTMAMILAFCFAGCNKQKATESSQAASSRRPDTSENSSDAVSDGSSDVESSDISSDNSSEADPGSDSVLPGNDLPAPSETGGNTNNTSSGRAKPVKTDPNAIVRVNWNGPAGYKIIVPARSADMMKAGKILQGYLKTKFNASVDVAEDSAAKTAKEILIGATNRTESPKNVAFNDYSMTVKGGRLVFGAGSYQAAEKAVGIFVNQQNPAGQVQEFSGTNDFETTRLGQYKYVWGDEFNGLGFSSSKYFVLADETQALDPWEDTDVVSDDPSVLDVSDGYLKLNNRRWYNPTNGTVEYVQHEMVSTKNTMNYQ